jgi:DNA-binding NarL/FixJ family response regulator
MMNTITILIADQSEILKAGIQSLLSGESDLSLLENGAGPEDLFDMIQKETPDILLSGLIDSKERTIQVLREVNKCRPDTHLILLADDIKEHDLIEFVKMGLKGYLSTRAQAVSLKKALRAVAGGEYWINRNLIGKIFNEYLPTPHHTDTTRRPETSPLTKRQEEILKLLGQGFKNKDIADQLIISEKTVKTHLTNIFSKLKIHSRLQAALHLNGHDVKGLSSSLSHTLSH